MGAFVTSYKANKMSLVNERYHIEHKLGQGSFGVVFHGLDTKRNERVAVKLELKTSSLLAREAQVYKLLRHGVGFPKVRWFGQIMPFYDVIVMDLLGTNLGDLFNECGNRFSIKTVLMLADQMISRLEYLHNMNILHRDIKPENFVMGVGNTRNTLYLVDFGLSKTFRDVKTNQHMCFRDGKSLTGTARYASVNTHQGIEATRRDDLESVGYVLVYFLRGFLPWQGVARKQSKKHRYSMIGEMKRTIQFEELCDGCPQEFVEFLRYCRGLEFTERPDYAHLRQMFRDLLRNLGCDYNYDYDWSGKVPLYS